MNAKDFFCKTQLRILSADITGAMEMLRLSGVGIENVFYEDALHLRFWILSKNRSKVLRILKKRGDEVTVLRQTGMLFPVFWLKRRPFLVLWFLGVFFLTLWLPTRVFFVRVEGNESVSTGQIIDAGKRCGIYFGVSRRQIRSEKVKNELLEALPQLQWTGVNTYGCVAVITVRERTEVQKEQNTYPVSNIVASVDAVVREVTVLKGNALCAPGQTVKKGEILVAGSFDNGFCLQSGAAAGEVFGETERPIEGILPSKYVFRQTKTESIQKYSLIIGKKRINFSKGSGISGTSCAKIYEEKYLTLPGGFQLPIALCVEQWYDYDTYSTTLENNGQYLAVYMSSYLPGQMVAGKIVDRNELVFDCRTHYLLRGTYNCYEMIGVIRPEEHLNE